MCIPSLCLFAAALAFGAALGKGCAQTAWGAPEQGLPGAGLRKAPGTPLDLALCGH